ncbi:MULTISPECIES: tetratricopeptide repeat protein [Sphingobacterium]|uniref:Tetratricopeptide repeat protein n=1 Tax=Sphingobacterium tenebrionis TaxID=3111775 RepID=A0ABU8I961_9SPHI|nr:tetratricopeptide repeat protein [Sphingobacterium sp. 1.A.4]
MEKILLRRLWMVSILLLLGTFVFAQDLKDNKEYKEKLQAIEAKLKSGDIPAALAGIEEVLQKYPKGAEMFYAKSLLYAQARNFDVAIPAAQQAVNNDPDNLIYRNHLLELYKSSGDLDSAIGLINEVLEKNDKSPAIFREKVMLLHAAKRSDEALDVIEISNGKFGESDTLDVLKAEILMDMDKDAEAATILNKWRQKKSPIRQVYSALGFLNLENNKPNESVKILMEGLENTKDDLLYFDLADAYVDLKKEKLAYDALKTGFQSSSIGYFDKHRVMYNVMSINQNLNLDQKQELANILVLKHPRVADTHMFKGDVLWQKGELDQAKSLYLTAVSMQPQLIDAWRKLVELNISSGDTDQAIRDGQEGLKLNPGNVMLTYYIGVAHLVKKDFENARKYLETALNQSENENAFIQSTIYTSLGDLYHELKMTSASDVAYEEAIKLDSTNVGAMNNYAYYLALRKSNLDVAAKYAAKANDLNQKSGTFQDTYAWVLFQQEKFKEALYWIEQAVKNSEGSAVLFEHYGDILMKLGRNKEAIKQWEKALTMSDNSSVDKEKIKQKISEKKYIE